MIIIITVNLKPQIVFAKLVEWNLQFGLRNRFLKMKSGNLLKFNNKNLFYWR